MTDFHILGLFPEILDSCFAASLIGKARAAGMLTFHYHQLRNWGMGNYRQVDDKPYGGGRGMVLLADVTCRAVRELKSKYGIEHVVLTSPRGKLLTPQVARQLSQKKSILFLCPRYEGVDERAVNLVVDEEISIGNYVITGGELAAAVIIDAACRFIPGVIGQEESVSKDSFENDLLEHAHYTRPEIFEGQTVPSVLLAGHHAEIEEWRQSEALKVTQERRPELSCK